MTLTCPKALGISYEGMDDMADYSAQQGHRYALGDKSVLALDHGTCPRVAEIRDGWIGEVLRVEARVLVAEPMRYHGGEAP